MKTIKPLFLTTLLGFSSYAFAGIGVNFEAGAAFSQLSNSQYLSPITGLENSYSANEAVQIEPFVGLGAEYDFAHLVPMPFSFGLGLSAYYIDLGTISGTETPGINQRLTAPLDYSMSNQSLALMVEPKIIYTAYRLQPYVFGGIGCAWNTLGDYTETVPSGSTAVPADNLYGSHTEANFAYEAGAGVQYALWRSRADQHLFLRAEYRYFNLGQSQLNAAVGQGTNDRMSVNSATNIIDLGLDYQFE